MKTLSLFFVLLLTISLAHAQVAIINDKDGYTNVKQNSSSQSKIIYEVESNVAIWYNYDFGRDTAEWVPVYIPKNIYSTYANSLIQIEDIKGFIHVSRLKPLDKLKPYEGEEFKFQIQVEPFNLNNREIEKNNNAVIAIGGKPVWGTDGDLPRTQVKMVSATIEGRKVEIDKTLYSDIYECNTAFDVFKNGNTYFVYQWNSDGAGAYQIVWVFTKAGLKQRLVGSII